MLYLELKIQPFRSKRPGWKIYNGAYSLSNAMKHPGKYFCHTYEIDLELNDKPEFKQYNFYTVM